jgi:glutathione S-transferase
MMNAPFKLYGAELSPYSVKVRAYLRFKGLPFEWLERSLSRQEEFTRYAKLPLAPILVDAEDNAMQDSTPMIEALERAFPEPSIIPEDAALAFVSALLEDYADEWLNKAMFHYRWTYPADQDSAAKRIGQMMYEGAPTPEGVEEAIKTRMVGRLHHVGSSPETAPAIEASFARLLSLLEPCLRRRAYLFGARPSLADFGLAGQLAQLLSDPTAGALIKAQAPGVALWVDRMENPEREGAFASLETLRGDLGALLQQEIAPAYLSWMAANAQAVADDAPGVSVELPGGVFSQKPQRYAAKALGELRRKRAGAAESESLAALLSETGCDASLMSASPHQVEVEGEAGGEDDAS